MTLLLLPLAILGIVTGAVYAAIRWAIRELAHFHDRAWDEVD